MANRQTHVVIGTACGGALAYCRADGQSPADRIAEMIGGLLGGYAGARLADVIDVPTSPHHRSHAHSAAGGVAIVATAGSALFNWEIDLRHKLQEVRARRANAVTDWDRMCLGSLEVLLQIAVGVLSGLIAGHISHLALDAFTPRGLPLA